MYSVFKNLTNVNTDFSTLPLLGKGCEVMCFKDQYSVSKMIYVMFQRRKIYYVEM